MSGVPDIWSHPEFIRRQFQISRLQTTIATISKTRDELQVALNRSHFQQQTFQNRLHLATVECNLLKSERDGLAKQNGELSTECNELKKEVDYWKSMALGYQKAASPGHSEQLCVSEPQDDKMGGNAQSEQGGILSVKKENN